MLSEVDTDPRKEIEVDPDPERGSKWIRFRQNVVDPAPQRCFSGYILTKS